MNGFEAAQKIRSLSDPIKSKIPIIATSANVLQSYTQKCEQYGINDMLPKPITLEALLKAILQQ